MNLTMLGTGHALVTECYNTCFVITDEDKRLLVDGGGGNTILRQLKIKNIGLSEIHDIFVTHKHTDHLLGIIWIIRVICQQMNQGKYEGALNIYTHDEVLFLIRDMVKKLLLPREFALIDDRIALVEVVDGQCLDVIGHKTIFLTFVRLKRNNSAFLWKLEKMKN